MALALALTLGGTPIAHAQEGIKVHGDWTLTVRDPDGTVTGRYEFKNALKVQVGANRLLADLLVGNVTPGKWMVYLAVDPGTVCNPAGGVCTIAGDGSVAPNSTNLTAVVPGSGPDANKLVLSGSMKFSGAGNIGIVGTFLSTCTNTVAPASCATPTFREVTEKILAPAVIPVIANQTVDVVVVIGFS